MRRFKSPHGLLLLTTLSLSVACDQETPTSASLDVLEPQLHSGEICQSVEGTITESLTGLNTAAGTIAGDLEGPIRIVIAFGPQTGKVQHFTAEHTIGPLTGGAFAGATFPTSDKGVFVGDPPVLRINNHIDVVSGGHGSITTHGTLDLTLPSDQVQLSYRGVVCR